MSARYLSKLGGALLALVSVVAVQGSAALAEPVFDVVAPTAVVAWRLAVCAVLLVCLAAWLSARGIGPRLIRRRPRREVGVIGSLGLAMAAMNVAFYHAVAVLPLGVAATLMFLGPLTLALLGSRAWGHVVFAVLALVGVVLISGPSGTVTPAGLGIGLAAGAALAAYTVLSRQLGSTAGLDGLALATTVAALVLLAVALGHVHTPGVCEWLLLVATGGGLVLTFVGDFLALGLVGTRTVATLFALDPVVGAVVGVVVLGDVLTAPVAAGIVCVAVAGAAAVITAPHHAEGAAASAPSRLRLNHRRGSERGGR